MKNKIETDKEILRNYLRAWDKTINNMMSLHYLIVQIIKMLERKGFLTKDEISEIINRAEKSQKEEEGYECHNK
jgi:hypothetical protein